MQNADGRLFDQFVVDEILEPMNMAGAGLLLTDEIEARLAVGYDNRGEQTPYRHIAGRPSGALNATPAQMGNFVRMLLNRGQLDGRRLVSPQSIERMERSETTLAAALPLDQGYGLGNFSWSVNGFIFRGHDGGMPGYHSQYGYLVDQGLGYCVMVSVSNASLVNRIRGLVSEYLVRDLEKPSAPTITEMPTDIDRWIGYYRPITPRHESTRYVQRLVGVVRIRREFNTLVVSLPGRVIEFNPAGNHVFKRRSEPMTTLAFVEGPNGANYVQGESGNLRRVSAAVVWFERIAVGLVGLLMFSSPIWAIVWVPLKLFGRPSGQPIGVRIWPLLAVTTLVTAGAVIGVNLQGGTSRPIVNELGQPSAGSIAFVVLSWIFVLLTVLALTYAFGSDPRRVGQLAHLHSKAVSVACLLAAIYLLSYRAIGFPPWW